MKVLALPIASTFISHRSPVHFFTHFSSKKLEPKPQLHTTLLHPKSGRDYQKAKSQKAQYFLRKQPNKTQIRKYQK